MTAAILLVTGLAIWSAAAGRRDFAITLFSIAFVVSVMWLDHHMADPLVLAL